MKVIAHRGFSKSFPENTRIAFEKAIECGAQYIECDVQEIAGGYYIFHDFYLERLTNFFGSIDILSHENITQLKIQQAHNLVSVEELFELLSERSITLNLEVKSIKNVQDFASTIERLRNHYTIPLVLSSFNHHLLDSLRNKLRDSKDYTLIRYAALVAHLPLSYAQYAVDFQADIAAIDAHLVTAEFVKHAHMHNLEVWCYTVNDEVLLKRCDEFGVDAIFSDDPEWAISLTKRL